MVHSRLAEYRANVRVELPQERHVKVECHEAPSGGKGGMDSATESRVQQRRDQAAMDSSQRVVVVLADFGRERDAAFLNLDGNS